MTINFTGIKNVGSMLVTIPQTSHQMHILSAQLTNDEEGNDLDEFNKAIEKTGHPEDFRTAYEGAVSIQVSTDIPEEEYEKQEYSFHLNGSELEVNDENIPVYTYLAKLTRHISHKKNSELGGKPEYAASKDFLNGSALGYFVKRAFIANPNANLFPLLNGMFMPENVRNGAKTINRSISETMTDYLC